MRQGLIIRKLTFAYNEYDKHFLANVTPEKENVNLIKKLILSEELLSLNNLLFKLMNF